MPLNSACIKNVFTVHLIDERRRLIFDCEALGRPLLATAERLGIDVPFLVLNLVAIYSGAEVVPLERFTSMWSNPSVAYSRYRDKESELKLTVVNMLPDGFSVSTHSLKREVLDCAVESSQSTGKSKAGADSEPDG